MKCLPIRTKSGAIECDRCGTPFPVTADDLALFPGCAETLKCIKSQCVGLGVGDRLARLLKFVGVTQYRLKRWLGVNCNCQARQEKLNRIGWLIAKRLLLGKRKGQPRFKAMRPARVNPACPVHGDRPRGKRKGFVPS